MLFSKYFLKTEKTRDSAAPIISAKLLKQGGFVRESVAGRYYFLPIGYRVQQKIISVIREEMDNAGCQEMSTPVLHPIELWKETNRTSTTGFELMKIKDRRGVYFVLGGTAEEMFVDLIRQFRLSYKDLPFHLYQFSSKFRDELRVRGGLLRVREFIMKDGYSFHKDESDFNLEYEKMKKVYTKIFNRLGLETFIAEADNGYIGGDYCHEFIVESEAGESKFFVSEDNKYASHEDVAIFKKLPQNIKEKLKPLKMVEAKRGKTMEHGVKFHKLPLWQQIKTVLFADEQGRFVLSVIRGDFEVNETKLKNLIKAIDLRYATDAEIRGKLNSEPGFISPVGIKEKAKKSARIIIVADDSLRAVRNSYGGSNKKNKDLLNVNIDRDYKTDIEGDIALAHQGYEAPGSKGKLIEKRGIEVGNIFQLGEYYSKKMKGAVYIDSKGREKPFYMGCYGIGVGRTMSAIVEKYHDAQGIIWPEQASPFKAILIKIGKDKKINDLAEKIYRLNEKEILYDDRENKSAGEKFSDADLLGISCRIVVSDKTIKQQGAEIKKRSERAGKILQIKDIKKIL